MQHTDKKFENLNKILSENEKQISQLKSQNLELEKDLYQSKRALKDFETKNENLVQEKENISFVNEQTQIRIQKLEMKEQNCQNNQQIINYTTQISQLQKQISVIQLQNIHFQDEIEVQKREFNTYMNNLSKNKEIESFDKLPIFQKIMNDIAIKAKLKDQENQIRSLHKQAEYADKNYKNLQIEFSNYKLAQEQKYYQLTKKKDYVKMTQEWVELNQDLEIQIHNLKSMIQIQEHEINDKKIDIKILSSGQKFSKKQIIDSKKEDYKILCQEARFKFKKEGKTDYCYLETQTIKQNIYIDEIIIFGSCGGHNSYIYLAVFDEDKNIPITSEYILFRNFDEPNIYFTDIQNFNLKISEGDILQKMQQINSKSKVYAKSVHDQSLIIVQELSVVITYLDQKN